MSGRYRDFHIVYSPPPIPYRGSDWQYWHDDYDGAPDAHDNRYGHCASEAECHAEIDEWYLEQQCLSPAEQKSQGDRCGCRGADDYCVCQNVPDKQTLAARSLP